MADNGYHRETAKRVFVGELLEASITKKEEGKEKAPVFTLTPTGALVNRVLIIGAMIDTEEFQGDNPMWTGRLSDPTGVIQVKAGEYNPEAMAQLSQLEPPCTVALIGKPNIYFKNDTRYVSVRAETIRSVSDDDAKTWILDTSRATIDRLKLLKESKGEHAKEAIMVYSPDIEAYKELVDMALTSLENDRKAKRVEMEVEQVEPIEVVDLRGRR